MCYNPPSALKSSSEIWLEEHFGVSRTHGSDAGIISQHYSINPTT